MTPEQDDRLFGSLCVVVVMALVLLVWIVSDHRSTMRNLDQIGKVKP